MNDRAELAAGLLLADDSAPDPASAIAEVTAGLRIRLNPTSVWQSGDLSPELRGDAAYGQEVVRWSPPEHVTPDEAEQLETAWSDALPPLDPETDRYLRLRVDSTQVVRQLRAIGTIDGLTIVPSLDLPSRRHRLRWQWRWPLRVGVVAGALADNWLATLKQSGHEGYVLDAERFEPAVAYDIAIVSATELSSLSADVAGELSTAACVIVAGDGSVEDYLTELDQSIASPIAVAVAGPPERWSQTLFDHMSRDVPIDAAVESIVRTTGIDALLAGPRYGMDITAATRWMAAVAPGIPELGQSLELIAEAGTDAGLGTVFAETNSVRLARARGVDPVAVVLSPVAAEGDFAVDGGGLEEEEPPPPAEVTTEEPPQPRRLVARAYDGDVVVKSTLPPNKALRLGVRIAIPEAGDAAADTPFPLPDTGRPTVELEVVVSGDVWTSPPESQTISISREDVTQPSTWAVFPFTTPNAGRVVSIEIRVLYQGKPLQAATYVSPVRDFAIHDERPTLTTFRLSGPDEPSDELRPVDVTLDATGADLKRCNSDSKVFIPAVQEILEYIEGQVSTVLGESGAPNSFDDPRAVRLLITLARQGIQLGSLLTPLGIGNARSINIIIQDHTPVLPLEMVYAGPAPGNNAKLCDHVSNPPPLNQACEKVSTKLVCPYAFWGLYRSIARTVQWEENSGTNTPPWTSTICASSVLCGATAKADAVPTNPLPTNRVIAAAKGLFGRAALVWRWSRWREKIQSAKPNLLVILGHTMTEDGASLNLYLGQKSVLERFAITASHLRAEGSPRPLVLLIACASAVLHNPLGSLPGAFTAEGAGAVVGTLSKITGPHAATAVEHLLRAIHDLADKDCSVGDAVQAARRSLIAERQPAGLVLVSHGEMDTKLALR